MALPSNILQNVQTYQKAELAWLLNSFCFISHANKKFKDFNSLTANLGDTVTFDLAPRYVTYGGLVITQQQSTQRVMPLTCSQAANVTAAYSDQQFIFNVREYMDRFGEAAMKELGTAIESDLAQNIISNVTINDPQNANFGVTNTASGPYRFFGDGVTAINSYGQLAQALANFRDYGANDRKVRGYLPMISVPAIVSSGLNQFAVNRNNEIANSWELGRFSECDWYESNLLPTQIAGTIGNATAPNNTMTLVSTNDPTGNNVTTLTFTDPAGGNVTNSIMGGDLFQFIDNVSGQKNVRYLTFIGHKISNQPVQVRALNDANTSGGSVTISILPALCWNSTNPNYNLSTPLTAGMKATVLPSHRAGLITSGDQFYMAMPQLPDESPFETVRTVDKDSGASIRHYFGSQFGQNVRAYVRDAIWGSVLVPENSMRLIFPM